MLREGRRRERGEGDRRSRKCEEMVIGEKGGRGREREARRGLEKERITSTTSLNQIILSSAD